MLQIRAHQVPKYQQPREVFWFELPFSKFKEQNKSVYLTLVKNRLL
jgi:hypothetical protein